MSKVEYVKNGKTVTYERKVTWVIMFSTLSQRERFIEMYDESDEYELHDVTTWMGYGNKATYLDRVIVRSTKEDREKLVETLGLEQVKRGHRKTRRYGWIEYVVGA